MQADTDQLIDPNTLISTRDINNEKALLRRESLLILTLTQALVQELHRRANWYVRTCTDDDTDAIKYLFFAEQQCLDLLKVNFEVLLMDCTYRTNRYSMPLLVIVGFTNIGTSFYAGFCFMCGEKEEDFAWVFQQLQELYKHLDLPDPVTFVTDCDLGLINALKAVYPTANLNLCIWHVLHDLPKVKKSFDNEEEWEECLKHFRNVLMSRTEATYS